MANNTGGFGLRTVMTTGNTPATSGQSNYQIESGLDVGIFKNNPVSLNDGRCNCWGNWLFTRYEFRCN